MTASRPPRRRRAADPSADGDAPEPEAAPPSDPFDRLRRGAMATAGAGETDAEDEHAWMTTYTDMVTLLLTCFIMLISLATFTDRAEPIAAPPPAPAGAVDRQGLAANAGEPRELVPDALFLRQPPDSWTARLSRDLERFVGSVAVSGAMTVERSETVVTVRLNDRLLFPSGKVELEEAGRALLRDLAPMFRDAPARVEVQGHTDSVPIASWLFASNWELSAARAAAVVRALVEAGLPADRLVAAGYADTVPRADDATPAGRQENRRVELVLRTRFETPEARGMPAPDATR